MPGPIGNTLYGGATLIFDYTMDTEPSAQFALVDISSNQSTAAPFGGAYAAIIEGYNAGGPGTGNARTFGAFTGAYGYQNTALQSGLSGYSLVLEMLVYLPALPANTVDIAGLFDASGNETLGIAVNTSGQVVGKYYNGSAQTVTAATPSFPNANWVHLVIRAETSVPKISVFASTPGYSPTIVATASATLSGTITTVQIHPSQYALAGVDRVRLYASTALALVVQPYQIENDTTTAGIRLAATPVGVLPTSSAGCTAQLSVQPQQILNPDGTPYGVGVGDALNTANWYIDADDGQINQVVEVIPSQLPAATAGLWFDLTFQLPLDAGVNYTLGIMNLISAGDLNVGSGAFIQANTGNFIALQSAVPLARTPQETLYGIDVDNPSGIGDYQIDGTGDYQPNGGLEALKKRIFRRLETPPNGFSMLPGYGIGVPGFIKKLQTNDAKRQLISRIEKQLSQEPGVLRVSATLTPLVNGNVLIYLAVQTANQTVNLKYLPRQ